MQCLQTQKGDAVCVPDGDLVREQARTREVRRGPGGRREIDADARAGWCPGDQG